MRRIPREKIVVKLDTETEYDTPESAAGGDPEYAQDVRAMMEKHNNDWNWCCAKVKVTIAGMLNGPSGTSYLGHCCYENEEDFIQNSGYYETMINDAIAELHTNFYNQCEHIRQLGVFDDHNEIIEDLKSLADGEDDELGKLLLRAVKALRFEYEKEPETIT